jgi:hypothetical protein
MTKNLTPSDSTGKRPRTKTQKKAIAAFRRFFGWDFIEDETVPFDDQLEWNFEHLRDMVEDGYRTVRREMRRRKEESV